MKKQDVQIINVGDDSIGVANGSSVAIINNTEDISVVCEDCKTLNTIRTHGAHPCEECGNMITTRVSSVHVTKCTTINDAKKEEEYLNLIAQIDNARIRKEFEKAYKLSLKVESIAPREPSTWIVQTLSTFYYQKKLCKSVRNFEIVDKLFTNLKLAEQYEVSKKKLDEMRSEIADYLFQDSRAKLGHNKRMFEQDFKKWERTGLNNEIYYLTTIENCFTIYNDLKYLQTVIDELSIPYKWITKDRFGVEKGIIRLKNSNRERKYDPVKSRSKLIKKVKQIDPFYKEPLISKPILITKITKK